MRYVGIALVQAWRLTFGRLTPAGTCKYYPSCSQYAIDAFRVHGLVQGRSLRRAGGCFAATHGVTGASTAAEDAQFGRRHHETEHPA